MNKTKLIRIFSQLISDVLDRNCTFHDCGEYQEVRFRKYDRIDSLDSEDKQLFAIDITVKFHK